MEIDIRKDRRAQEAAPICVPSCTYIGARRSSLDLSGRSRKWSTGAKKLPPRSDLFQHVSTSTCARVYVSERFQPVRSEKPSTGRYNDDEMRRATSFSLSVTSHLFLVGEENCGTHIRTFLRTRPPTARNAMDVRRVVTRQLAASDYVTRLEQDVR